MFHVTIVQKIMSHVTISPQKAHVAVSNLGV